MAINRAMVKRGRVMGLSLHSRCEADSAEFIRLGRWYPVKAPEASGKTGQRSSIA